ncbi:histidyl-tRNA synthetase, partial [Striga asiatica]
DVGAYLLEPLCSCLGRFSSEFWASLFAFLALPENLICLMNSIFLFAVISRTKMWLLADLKQLFSLAEKYGCSEWILFDASISKVIDHLEFFNFCTGGQCTQRELPSQAILIS